MLFQLRSLSAQSSLSPTQVGQLNAFVEQLLAAVEVVPGLGLAVVRGEEIVYQKGFGYRDLENHLPVTPETGFYIASVTKSITGMAAARLEAAGRLSLDSSLATYFPQAQFDPGISAERLSLLDLLTHNHTLENSGIAYRLAFVGEMSPATFERVMADFSTPRRRQFEYANTGYNILAGVIENVTGQSWKEINAAWVLGPVGMHHTTAYTSRATLRPFAYPYQRVNTDFARIPLKTDAQMQAAGGYISTPRDLARWLLLNINAGQLGEKRVIPAAVLRRVHYPWARQERRFFQIDRYAYGIGWNHGLYEGDTLLHHFGGYDGFSAHTSFMPEHGLGVVALTNESHLAANLPHLVAAYVYDLLLGKPGLEEKYQAQIVEVATAIRQSRTTWGQRLQQKAAMVARARENPAQWAYQPAQFSGTYHNPRLGEIIVSTDSAGKLLATWGPNTAALLPAARDQFIADWSPFEPPVGLGVSYTASGEVAALHYEHREFRRLPAGVHPPELEEAYSTLRRELQQALQDTDDAGNRTIRTVLDRHYPTGIISEPYLNTFGYRYLRSGNTAAALAFFHYAVDRYPTSANAFDSLGEAYLKTGNREQARRHYARSLALNPQNKNARRILAELD